MEKRAERFYLTAAAQTQDAHTRKLLGDLAGRSGHHRHATDLEEQVRQEGEEEEETANRQFILTWVQPGLAG